MSKSKPVDELTIEDFIESPIWEWAIDEEDYEHQDETWVRPAETTNFTEELNGSIVSGELATNAGEKFPMMCSLDIEDEIVLISSVVYYSKNEQEYYSLEESVKGMDVPLLFKIGLIINGKHKSLEFTANKVNIYKNEIKTNLD
jgi:hypothetical protein